MCECVCVSGTYMCLTDLAIVPDGVQSPHLDANEYIGAMCTAAQWSYSYCSMVVFEMG